MTQSCRQVQQFIKNIYYKNASSMNPLEISMQFNILKSASSKEVTKKKREFVCFN